MEEPVEEHEPDEVVGDRQLQEALHHPRGIHVPQRLQGVVHQWQQPLLDTAQDQLDDKHLKEKNTRKRHDTGVVKLVLHICHTESNAENFQTSTFNLHLPVLKAIKQTSFLGLLNSVTALTRVA